MFSVDIGYICNEFVKRDTALVLGFHVFLSPQTVFKVAQRNNHPN